MNKSMITTGLELPGYSITESHGIVRGISVRSLHIGSKLFAIIRNLVGGRIGSYERITEKTREESLNRLIQDALAKKANAIIGMRYDAHEGHGVAEIVAYGTAVTVEKNNRNQ